LILCAAGVQGHENAGEAILIDRDIILGTESRRRLGIALAAVLALGLAACGADGEPLPPPGAQNPVDINAPKPAPEEGQRPDRPFILDGLL
jgi:predicted small lipoprotein YifL